MPCIKEVGNIKCQYCQSETIKYGVRGLSQRYRCKTCKKIQLATYKNHAYATRVNSEIAAHVKEGCGIRSIARLLHISATTVISRIQKIANSIKKPAQMSVVFSGPLFEVFNFERLCLQFITALRNVRK